MRHNLIWFAIVVVGVLGCKPTPQPLSVPTMSVPTVGPLAVPTVAPGPNLTVRSGLAFTATLGPTCPGPQRVDQVCTAPYEGEFVVTRLDGSEAARFNTGVDGRAVVDLPPGDYTVSVKLETGKALPRGGPVEVNVTAGQYVEVALELDTGMR